MGGDGEIGRRDEVGGVERWTGWKDGWTGWRDGWIGRTRAEGRDERHDIMEAYKSQWL